MKADKYSISVLTAGMLWGCMGLFTRTLVCYGIGPSDAIIVRCGIAALCFGILVTIKNPALFKIRLKDFWCFFGAGFLSLLFFTFCYFTAIKLMTLSLAAILLYTAPTFVMILSAILFKERFTKIKLAALVLAFSGCCLVSGITNGSLSVSLTGFMFGIGAGFGYALYTIFSRFALIRGYDSNVINFYSCLFACIGALALWGGRNIVHAVQETASIIPLIIALGIFTCFLPYMLYTYGLTGLENSKASVLASMEPVVASVAGVLVYHEVISISSLIGILLVLYAVILFSKKI